MKSETTIRNIEQTVLSLLHSKRMDQISVTEVCKNLGISRSTFYMYFDSVYDVLEKIETDFVKSAGEVLADYQNLSFNDKYFAIPHPGMAAMLRFLNKKRDLVMTLLHEEYGDPRFQNLVKQVIRHTFYEKAMEEHYIQTYSQLDEIYMVEGHYGIFLYTLKHGVKDDYETMTIKMYQTMFGALRNYAH